jgi:hypothetical protein
VRKTTAGFGLPKMPQAFLQIKKNPAEAGFQECAE